MLQGKKLFCISNLLLTEGRIEFPVRGFESYQHAKDNGKKRLGSEDAFRIFRHRYVVCQKHGDFPYQSLRASSVFPMEPYI